MPDLLACPLCTGPLRHEGERLRCSCGFWPVVADVPILLPWARNRTPTSGELLARFRPPAEGLVSKILRRVLSGAGPLERAISRKDATFLDLAAELGRTRDLDYFRYRFSDLSYLATAALLTPLTRGPVLDLGCGAGHGLRAIFQRLRRTVAVGLDTSFPLLYLAKRFVAPDALYVCADASARLPFRDGAFESALSADMFQFLTNGRSVARELLRVTRGPILLSHFYPPEGRSGSGSSGLDGPSALEIFAERGPRLHDEEAILDVFLSRRELDLSLAPPERNEVLVLTSGVEPRKYPGADYFVAGSVLNPIYDVREEGEQLHLQRRFLSEKYTERLRRYDPLLPERLTVTREQIAARDPELVRRFVLLDLPPNYC